MRLRAIFLGLLLAPHLAPELHAAAAPAAAAPRTATLRGVPSRELLSVAEQALAQGAAAVRQAPGWMGGAHSPHAALAAALAELDQALGGVRAAWTRGSTDLPRSLRRSSVALAGLRVAWGRSGLAAPQAGRRLRVVADALTTLRVRHGPEAARAARGGGLTPAEMEQLARLQRAYGRLAFPVQPLRARAAAGGDRTLSRELGRWASQSEQLAAAEPSLDTLLAALWLADQLAGEWRAAARHLPPGDPAALAAAGDAVEEVLGESEVGFVFVADLGEAESTDRVAQKVRAADGVEIAVLGPAAGDERGYEPAPAAGGDLQGEGAWEDVASEEQEAAATDGEEDGLAWDGGEGSWWDAEPGWEEVEAGDEREAEVAGDEPSDPAAEAILDGEDAAAAAGAATSNGAEAVTSFEVVTDAGEVLIVEVGPDGTVRTRAKEPPVTVPAPPAPGPLPDGPQQPESSKGSAAAPSEEGALRPPAGDHRRRV